MAKVSELKERARALEQQGDLAKARAIYEHILKHLEGTAALKAELPMYVKVGDLALKLGDSAAAVAMYEKAAEHYAAAGSARSIGALAEKIRRADPTRDDAAVGLGQALLGHGHAGAAAEVVIRYARRVERDDVVGMLEEVAPEAYDPASCERLERALSLLTGPVPRAPEPVPEPEPAPPPPEPVVSAQPPEPSTAEHARQVWEAQEAEEEALEEAPRLDLPLLSFEPEPASAAPAPPVSEADDGLLIRHGVEEPSVEPTVAAEPPREPEPVEGFMATSEAAASAEAGAAPEESGVQEEAAPTAEPAFYLPEEREPEAVPAPALEVTQPAALQPEARPSRDRGWPAEPHVLVREPRVSRERPVGLLAGVALAVIVVGGAAAWALGLLPFGRGESGLVDETPPPNAPLVTESVPPLVDTAAPADSPQVPADTTRFGPIGFNVVTNAQATPPVADTARADTALPVIPPPEVATTPQPTPTLPRVVVPPGHAIADEIVVVPGLEVVSVAETRAGGAPGIRVIQRAEDGEVAIVATPADFGADTVGRGQVALRTEGDTVIGDVRVGRYLVEARSTLPADVLSGFLGRLIRARPVN